MSTAPVATRHALTILAGPERAGSEQRWRVRLDDGRLAVLARLLPELAADPAIRRRYVHDLDRLGAIAGAGLAPILEVGPTPDPRDPAAPPPWRLRLDPPGETLAAWLARRAPAPLDEVSAIGAALADRLAEIHDRGVIVRDLAPRCIVLGDDRQITLTDVGLARVDILSTRTAASLLIEDSPYVAPEELARTIVDPRADLHRLGVILFQALTGALPFGDGPALLRSDRSPPGLRTLRPDVPAALESVIHRCLAADPGQRPATARMVAAILRGQDLADAGPVARVVCQACGAPLRLGQRLCLGCGKEAVLFAHASAGADTPTYALDLTKASEDTEFSRRLQQTLGALASAEVPALNLVIGDRRMYSKTELARRHPLPLRLFDNLSKETADSLRQRLADLKIVTRVRSALDTPERRGRRVGLFIAALLAAGALALFIAGITLPGGIILVAAGLVALVTMLATRRRSPPKPLLSLRPAPAALPASDPLVRRLAAQLGDGLAADIREPIAELALVVQRLVDHRAANRGEAAELDRVLAPLIPLVDLIDAQVHGLRAIDRELRGLEEGAMVRALAASEARGEPPSAREGLLTGLDRLRALEDQRALALHRLLNAGDLLRRAADLGLGVHDEAQAHERQLQLALHALGE